MTQQKLSRRTFLAGLGGAAAPAGEAARLRVGCQANAFQLKPGDFTALLQAVRAMKSLGYAGFECNFRFVEAQFDRAPAARDQIRQTGLEFIGAHVSMQQLGGEQGARIAAGVAALGGDCLVVSGRGLAADGRFTKDALLEKARELERLARLLAERGLRLAYHNHNPEFANHNAEMNGLADNTSPDLVRFMVDAGHACLGGGDPAEFLARHASRVYGIHLKTYRGGEQVPLGQGDFDFQALAAAVKKTRWSGWLIIEEGGGPRPGNTQALGPDREYVRKVFGI